MEPNTTKQNVVIFERTQAYRELVVEYGVGTWNMGDPKNNFTYLQGHHISTTHEETFLDGCLNDLAKINRSRKLEEKEKGEHARLPVQVPASRVSKNPGGNNRQERKDAVSGQEHGKQEASDKLEDSKAKQKGDHPQLGEDHNAELNNVKAASAIAWQISPLCQQQLRGSHVPDGTDNMQLSSPPRRYTQEGKTAKVVTVTLSSL